MAEPGRYVENARFSCLLLENGVCGLGDLWNCRNSQSVGHNLFRTQCLCDEYLRVSPTKCVDYKFTHVKNNLDVTKTWKLEGHLSLDVLLKTITLKGNSQYRDDKGQREKVEVINCTYMNECYRIDLNLPVDHIVNTHVSQKICGKEIEATHVVGGVIIGATVDALIEIKEKYSNSDCQVSGGGEAAFGSEWLKRLTGEVSGELRANWEKKIVTEQCDTNVTCKARPMPDDLTAPRSVKELFELIEKIPSAMSKEKHFSMLSRHDITGVPVQFILYPLSDFVNFETELLYKQLEDDLLNDFQETIAKASDLQQSGYIKKLLLEKDSQLKWLLHQKYNLSESVRQRESQLREVGQKYLNKCRETLKEYKYGRHKPEELGKIVRDFDSTVYKLLDESENKIDSPNVRLFTDISDAKKWLQFDSKTKILLEVKLACLPALAVKFNELANSLSALDIKMGKLTVNISEDSSDVRQEDKIYLKSGQKEVYFKDTDMREALEILHSTFCTGNKTRASFYRIITELHGIKFPTNTKFLSEWSDYLHTLIQRLHEYSTFYVPESANDFQDYIRKLPDDTMAMCVPIGAPETSLDFFLNWEDNILQSLKGAKWVACSFESVNIPEAPLLMVFCKDKMEAVCLDQLDLQILKHHIKSANKYHVKDVEFSLFSVNRLQNSLYSERASYAYRVYTCIAPKACLDAVQSQRVPINQDVEELLSIITSCLSSDMLIIISTVAQMAAENSPALVEILKICGWNETIKKFDRSMIFGDQRSQLIRELDKWVGYRSLVNEIDDVEKLLTGKKDKRLQYEVIVILHKIAFHSLCPAEYKKLLIEQQSRGTLQKHIPKSLKDLRSKIEQAASNPKLFHVAALKLGLNCCDSCDLESLTLLTEVLTKEYRSRVLRVVPDCIGEGYLQSNQLYFLLRSLSIYKYEEWQRVLHDGLRRLRALDDSDAVLELIQKLSKTCNKEQTEWLWKNDKWQLLVSKWLDAQDGNAVRRSAEEWLSIKNVLPKKLRQRLKGAFRDFKGYTSRNFTLISMIADIFHEFTGDIARLRIEGSPLNA